MIDLARDARNGPGRLLLLSGLERSADPRARATLMELGTDPELEVRSFYADSRGQSADRAVLVCEASTPHQTLPTTRPRCHLDNQDRCGTESPMIVES